MGRQYDQVGTLSFRCLKDLDARIAHHDFDLVAGFALNFLAHQPLKPCSRIYDNIVERLKNVKK